MSVSSSLKGGPFTSLVLVKKKYLLFYFFEIFITIFTIQFELWLYWGMFYGNNFIIFYMFLPLLLFLIYVSAVLVSLLIAKIILIIINLFHKPREGVFLRDASDRDYRYWSLRNTIKKWPVWLAHKFPFPFLDNLCFNLFGVKTKFSNSLFEGWVDCEFIDIGKNVTVGQASIIQSSIIMGNLLIIRRTTIGDNVKIGAHTIVMPGTIISKDVILAANSVTTLGQVLEEGWVYLGVPAKKFRENIFFEEGLEEPLFNSESDYEEIRKKYEMLYLRRHDKPTSLTKRFQQKKETLEREKERFQKVPHRNNL